MRVFGKISLTLLFIPLFIIFLATTSIRFQLLNANFYISSLANGNVYQQTSDNLKSLIENNTQPGTQNEEVNTYLSLITPDNLKEVTENNIKNLFEFLNGKSTELIVFLPLDKIPASVLPFGFLLKGNEIPLDTLLTYFGRPGATINPIVLQRAQLITTASLLLWFLSILLLLLIIYSQIKMTLRGKRLVAPGVSLLLSGLLSLIAVGVVNVMKFNITRDWATSTEPSQVLFGPIVGALVTPITTLWTYIGIATVFSGIVLFFFKKRTSSKG